MSPTELLNRFLDQLAAVVGGMTGETATVIEAPRLGAAEWLAMLRARGPVNSTFALVFDAAGLKALAQASTGETEPTAAVIEDLLREVLAQAVGAVVHDPETGPLILELESLVSQAPAPSGEVCLARAIAADSLTAPLGISIWEAFRDQPPAPLSASASATAEPIYAPRSGSDRMDVILDIELPVIIRFGKTELPIRALTRLGPGSVLDLGRAPDDPVEMLVSGRVIATGQVVTVDGNYGIRILDVVSPSERMHSLEG